MASASGQGPGREAATNAGADGLKRKRKYGLIATAMSPPEHGSVDGPRTYALGDGLKHKRRHGTVPESPGGHGRREERPTDAGRDGLKLERIAISQKKGGAVLPPPSALPLLYRSARRPRSYESLETLSSHPSCCAVIESSASS